MTLRRRIEALEARVVELCPDPLVVIVRRVIMAVGPTGPVPTGRTIVSRFVDGEVVGRREEERPVENCPRQWVAHRESGSP